QIQFGIQNDIAMIYLDTSGPGLHKRGYRARANDAPLRETLAASMVELARYRGRECLYDPFCGSGTIIIEAAMIAQNRAPGLFRRFDVENWQMSDPAMWKQLRADARTCTFDRDFKLIGTDTDSHSLAIARENAVKAGVSQYVKFEQADARQFLPQSDSGVLITNPPYGERMLDVSEAEELYKGFGAAMRKYPDFHTYVISSHQDFERFYGKKATKRRKLYNGMIKCEYYMYY
ncbi:MAG: class I SAM-dependent RNA methyltransferase, partial [Clostridia bacterium]